MINQPSKTALITGGAKRIGRAIAMALAQDGYNIVVHFNESREDAKNLQKEILKLGRDCQIIKANLLNKNEVEKMLGEMRQIQNWSLLINNASIFYQSSFIKSDTDEMEKNFTIHLKVPAILSKALATNCQEQKLEGNIINMIDKNITRYETKYFDYLLSKKSLAEFTKMLALQLAPQVRVNGIAPGFVLNSINEENPDAETAKLLAKIPLHKKANEQDIIACIRYLLSNNFVTGHILFIDGGASLNHAG